MQYLNSITIKTMQWITWLTGKNRTQKAAKCPYLLVAKRPPLVGVPDGLTPSIFNIPFWAKA